MTQATEKAIEALDQLSNLLKGGPGSGPRPGGASKIKVQPAAAAVAAAHDATRKAAEASKQAGGVAGQSQNLLDNLDRWKKEGKATTRDNHHQFSLIHKKIAETHYNNARQAERRSNLTAEESGSDRQLHAGDLHTQASVAHAAARDAIHAQTSPQFFAQE